MVSVRIYDLLGREIKTLAAGFTDPGDYSVKWDAFSFPAGIYFCRIQTDYFHKVMKIVLLK
jgi:hypothetical protein